MDSKLKGICLFNTLSHFSCSIQASNNTATHTENVQLFQIVGSLLFLCEVTFVSSQKKNHF